MNSQRINLQPTSRKTASTKNVAGKENSSLVIAKISNTKRVEQLINDVRITACKTITNVKSSFNDFSQKLRRPGMKTRSSFSRRQNYKGLIENITPVKLYSPFTFVTPSPTRKTPKKRISPKRVSFKSPTGRFQRDVQAVNNGMKELEKLERSLSVRKLR